MKRILLGTILAGIGALTATATLAQDYPWKPDRPVTIIVPWAAGGSTDQMARIVATELEAELKQKFVVVNQPGASGSIGTKNAMEAAKDGYTWAAGAAVDVGTYGVLGLLDTGLKDWRMYFAVANVNVISANPSTPYKDFGQFLADLKSKGDSVTVATAGLSSAGHNFMESIKAADSAVKYKHITYNGGAPAVTATVAGETMTAVASGTVDYAFAEVTAVLELAKGGRVKILAVAADKRVANAPEVPTMSEAGLSGFEAYTWVGAMVGAKTPAAETARLAEWFTAISKMDETRAFYERLGATPMTGGPAQMHEFQKGEIALWKRIVQQAKVPLQ